MVLQSLTEGVWEEDLAGGVPNSLQLAPTPGVIESRRSTLRLPLTIEALGRDAALMMQCGQRVALGGGRCLCAFEGRSPETLSPR